MSDAPGSRLPVPDPWVGTTVGGRYRILELLAVGGMGAVYRAEHTLLGKVVALKLLHPELGGSEEAVRRFEREARSASRLSHEAIVPVTDFGRAEGGALYLVMELLAGEALAGPIARGPLEAGRAWAIARQILSALVHAHAQGVIHRDLKPDNVMVLARDPAAPPAAPDRIKLLDFGIAKLAPPSPALARADGPPRDPTLTRAGVVFGTPDYMAPEQAIGAPVDERADLYALGVLMFEMLTGRRPFEAESAMAVMSMHLTAEPPLPSQVAPGAAVPGAFDRVVRRALEKKPERRFGSAAEMLAALDEAAAVPGGQAAAPSTRILSLAGSGGPGKPARITLTLDLDNLRARSARRGRQALLLAAGGLTWAGQRVRRMTPPLLGGLARARVLCERQWLRLPPRWRVGTALALALAALAMTALTIVAARRPSPAAARPGPAAAATSSAAPPLADQVTALGSEEAPPRARPPRERDAARPVAPPARSRHREPARPR